MVGRWGMSDEGRLPGGRPARRRGPAAAGRRATSPRRPRSWSTPRCGGSSSEAHDDVRRAAAREPRQARLAGRGAARARDARRGRRLRGRRASSAADAARAGPPADALSCELIDRALAEDLGERRPDDRPPWCPPGARRAPASSRRRRACSPGCDVAEEVFERVDPELRWHAHGEEGEWRDGGLVAESRAPPRRSSPASGWRSTSSAGCPGVATLTARYVRAVEGTGVRDPRHAQDDAGAARAREGGGRGRRRGRATAPACYDAMLVKENHAALAGGVGEAARRALAAAPDGVAGRGRVREPRRGATRRSSAGATRLLLDNMAPDELRRAVALVGGRAELEASGGITLETVRAVRGDRRRLHQRRRAHPLGARARPVARARPALDGRFRLAAPGAPLHFRRPPSMLELENIPALKDEVRALAEERNAVDPGAQLPAARGPGGRPLRRRLARPLAPGGAPPTPR